MPDKDRELVLCVRANEVAEFVAAHGGGPWVPCSEGEVDKWIGGASVAFLPRSIAETDESWRHFGTYAVTRSGEKVISYRRGKSGSESRLHGALSIGVGGHVGFYDMRNQCQDEYEMEGDINSWFLYSAMRREFHEETGVDPATYRGWHVAFKGLIVDDSTPVGRVHVGAVYDLLFMSNNTTGVRSREACLRDMQWLTASEINERRDELESWSQIVLDNLLASQIGGGR